MKKDTQKSKLYYLNKTYLDTVDSFLFSYYNNKITKEHFIHFLRLFDYYKSFSDDEYASFSST